MLTAARRLRLRPARAGRFWRAAAAGGGGPPLARQCGMDHGRGAPHAAIYGDGVRRAVHLAGPTLHARLGAHQACHAPVRCEHPVRADGATHAAVDAQFWLVS